MKEADADAMLNDALAEPRAVPLGDMVAFVETERNAIWFQQEARLMEDMLRAPLPEAIERMQYFKAIERFLNDCKERPEKIISWLQKRTKGGRR